MLPAPCPSEQRMARLRRAIDWLSGNGFRVKADHYTTAPVPRYQITGDPTWHTVDGLLTAAVRLGWTP